MRAMVTLRQAREEGKFVTGLLFANPEKPAFDREVGMVEQPLSSLTLEQVRPARSALQEIMTSLRTGSGAPVSAGGG